MKFLDFFSGIGGFRLGLEMAGHECVGHCEVDKHADKSYRAMHNVKESEFYANDIRRIEPGDLPDADIYAGGFPCQAFSIAGNRGGFQDTRGTLFFEVMRLALVRRPRYLFLENVRGLLSHDGGRTFGTILESLSECGYDVQWQICNSRYWIPQNRERIFIIGHIREESRPKVFPITEISEETLCELRRVKAKEEGSQGIPCGLGKIEGNGFASVTDATIEQIGRGVASTVCSRYYKGASGHNDNLVIEPKQQIADFRYDEGLRVRDEFISPTLCKARDGRDISTSIMIIEDAAPMVKEIGQVSSDNSQAGKVYDADGIFPTLCAGTHGYAMGNVAVPVLTPDRPEKRQNGRRFKDDGDEMFTLTAQDKHGVAIMDGEHKTIRRLTPRECFRLQGFPDEYFDRAASVSSDTQLYKQAGNSVTVPVIYEIAKRLV
jgi:DNA (cytosine-5)-methyltransferase 1